MQFLKILLLIILFVLWLISVIRIYLVDPGRIPEYLSISLRNKSSSNTSFSVELSESDSQNNFTPTSQGRSLSRNLRKPMKRNSAYKSARSRFIIDTNSKKLQGLENDKEIQQPSNPSEIIDIQMECGNKKIDIPQFKICNKCNNRKPPRAKHCIECERCVLRKDRHCYLLGRCIGFYNYKFFILSLLYSFIILLITFDDGIEFLIIGLKNVWF